MQNLAEVTVLKSHPDTSVTDLATNTPAIPCEQLIAEAAYFRAEQRGFAPGNELGDWLDAEAEVKRKR